MAFETSRYDDDLDDEDAEPLDLDAAIDWSDYRDWCSTQYQNLWYFHYRWLCRDIAATAQAAGVRSPLLKGSGANASIRTSKISTLWGSPAGALSRQGQVRVAAMLCYGWRRAADNVFDRDHSDAKALKFEATNKAVIDAMTSLLEGDGNPDRYLLEVARAEDTADALAARVGASWDDIAWDDFVPSSFSSRWFVKPNGSNPPVTPALHARIRATVDAVGHDLTDGGWTPRTLETFPRFRHVDPVGPARARTANDQRTALHCWASAMIGAFADAGIRLWLGKQVEVAGRTHDTEPGPPELDPHEFWGHERLRTNLDALLQGSDARVQGAASKNYRPASPEALWRAKVERSCTRFAVDTPSASPNIFLRAADLARGTRSGPLHAAVELVTWYGKRKNQTTAAESWRPFEALSEEMRECAHAGVLLLLEQAKHDYLEYLRQQAGHFPEEDAAW